MLPAPLHLSSKRTSSRSLHIKPKRPDFRTATTTVCASQPGDVCTSDIAHLRETSSQHTQRRRGVLFSTEQHASCTKLLSVFAQTVSSASNATPRRGKAACHRLFPSNGSCQIIIMCCNRNGTSRHICVPQQRTLMIGKLTVESFVSRASPQTETCQDLTDQQCSIKCFETGKSLQLQPFRKA